MYRVLLVLAGGLAALGGSAAAFAGGPPGAAWVSGGVNYQRVEQSDHNCPGGQFGAGLSVEALYLRWTKTTATYEAVDHEGSCDGGIVGDSAIVEYAWTGGLMLGRSGWFVGAGPARVNVETSFANDNGRPAGRDLGTRYEFGWTSRRKLRDAFGIEVLLFKDSNDIRDFGGIAFNVSFGT